MICELCEVYTASSFHHFIPKTVHSNKWFKKRYSRADMGEGIDVCRDCHHVIHDLIPREKDLARDYNTVGKLKDHSQLRKYLKWRRR